MNDPDVRFQQLLAALKSRDFRLTPQRVELVRLIAVSDGHPNASALYAQIQQKFPTMSPATVYKTLFLLKDLHEVFEIDLREDSHYDGNNPEPHPHLVCLKCNRIQDGEIVLDSNALKTLEGKTGYRIVRPQVLLYGICPACQALNDG